MDARGLERFTKTFLDHKELEVPMTALKAALVTVIEDPKNCAVYDQAAMDMMDVNTGLPEFSDSEITETFFSSYLASRRLIAGLHQAECDEFTKHPLGMV